MLEKYRLYLDEVGNSDLKSTFDLVTKQAEALLQKWSA